MADIFSPEKRSEVMAKIRGKNTKVEVLVQRMLRSEGIYFQKHYRTKFGVVLDIASPRKKKAVQIDGDFWHGRNITAIKSRRKADDFWVKKLERNIARDKEQDKLLEDNGWTIFRVWESDILRKRTRETSLLSIKHFLTDGNQPSIQHYA